MARLQKPLPAERRRQRWDPILWLATGLGLGLSPIAPGTMGALLGLPLAWAVGLLPIWAQILVIVVLGIVGIPLSTKAARALGGGHDPGSIVFDEIASLPITFFLVPINGPWVLAVGFLLHRVMDITKPPPARQLERLPEGLGIMADDWMAAIYSCAALHLVLWLGWLPTAGG